MPDVLVTFAEAPERQDVRTSLAGDIADLNALIGGGDTLTNAQLSNVVRQLATRQRRILRLLVRLVRLMAS